MTFGQEAAEQQQELEGPMHDLQLKERLNLMTSVGGRCERLFIRNERVVVIIMKRLDVHLNSIVSSSCWLPFNIGWFCKLVRGDNECFSRGDVL